MHPVLCIGVICNPRIGKDIGPLHISWFDRLEHNSHFYTLDSYFCKVAAQDLMGLFLQILGPDRCSCGREDSYWGEILTVLIGCCRKFSTGIVWIVTRV